MLKTVIFQFAKAFPRKTDRIPTPEKVLGRSYDGIEAGVRLGAPMLAWLKQFLRNILTAKDNREKVIVWVYWPLSQSLVEQVSTPFTIPLLPLTSALTFKSDV